MENPEKYIVPNTAYEIMSQGHKYFNGDDEHPEDYTKALELYSRAAKLGSLEAFYRLGKIYYYGLGVERNPAKALHFLEQGANRGNYHCFGSIANIYLTENEMINFKKGLKYYDLYFNHVRDDFILDEDINLFINYLWDMYFHQADFKYHDILGKYKYEILYGFHQNVEYFSSTNDEDDLTMAEFFREISSKFNAEIKLIKRPDYFLAEVDLLEDTETGPMIKVSVKSGSISTGDQIKILGRNKSRTSRINSMKIDQEIVDHVSARDEVLFAVEGNYEDYLFVYDMATVVKDSE